VRANLGTGGGELGRTGACPSAPSALVVSRARGDTPGLIAAGGVAGARSLTATLGGATVPTRARGDANGTERARRHERARRLGRLLVGRLCASARRAIDRLGDHRALGVLECRQQLVEREQLLLGGSGGGVALGGEADNHHFAHLELAHAVSSRQILAGDERRDSAATPCTPARQRSSTAPPSLLARKWYVLSVLSRFNTLSIGDGT
jgi:hypothetical protein